MIDNLRRRYVYITDPQWQVLRERAAGQGITMSAYLRHLLNEEMGRKPRGRAGARQNAQEVVETDNAE